MPDLPAIRAFLEPRHHRLAAEIEACAASEIAGLEPQHRDEGARAQALRILRLLGAAGWCAQGVAREFGGPETAPDFRACCLVRETLAAASPLADSVFALQCLGSMPITLAGTEAQKRRYLPGVAAGELMAAFAMTEPAAGSDVSAIQTRARRDGDGYLLEGGKAFITNAGVAD